MQDFDGSCHVEEFSVRVRRHAAFSRALGLIASELKRLGQQDDGQDLVEYGLLIFLVALAAIASMKGLASSISEVIKSAATSLTTSS